MKQNTINPVIQNIKPYFQISDGTNLKRWKLELIRIKIRAIRTFIFIFLAILVAACSSEESIELNPSRENSLHITFSANSININSIDSAYVVLTNGEVSLKRYFEKTNNSLVALMNDASGAWEANFFLYTKISDSDYPRQYTYRKFFTINNQPVNQPAPTGSIIDTWYPRILLVDSGVRFLLGLSPEDRMVSVEVTAKNKWDYFSISKSAHHRNGNSVLVGHVFFEIAGPIQPPGILNFSDLDLDTEIADKQWNEIEIYGTLLDNESEEKPFYYRIAR